MAVQFLLPATVLGRAVLGSVIGSALRGVFGGGEGRSVAEGNQLFGDVFTAIANRPQPGTLGTIPAPAAPQPSPERPPIKVGSPVVVSTPPLIPAPAVPPGTPGRPVFRPPPSIPGLPSGPSIPDRIPPLTGVGAATRVVLQTILRGGWAGLLFYPREAGRGSALCVETRYGPFCPPIVQAVPAAVPLPGRGPRTRRRIPGTVVPPRRRERGRTQPAAQPRGRPVTISRPTVLARPLPRDIARGRPPMPTPPIVRAPEPDLDWVRAPTSASQPQSQPAAAPAPTLGSAILPASLALLGLGAAILARPSQVASRVNYRNPVLDSPLLNVPGVGAIPGIANPPQLGRVELPGINAFPQPLPGLATQPLTAFQAAVAQSPAQDLDRQCRERAKRKRKKREPRSVCYRGTFTETKRSTSKVRKEKIPCR